MENDNNTPGGGGPSNPDAAREQLATPAILLMVTGALGDLLGLWGLVQGMMNRGQALPAQFMNDPNLARFAPMIEKVQSSGWVTNVIVLALSAVVIVGALKMKNLENYSLAMAAAIIAMVPCFGPCCCIGIPAGIYALVLLNKPEIKSAFRS